VHQIADMHQQAPAERTAGMGAGEILRAEAARVEQRDRQRIPQRQRRGGAGRRRQSQGAGFLRHAGVEVYVRLACQGGSRVAGHGNELRTPTLDDRHDGEQLRTFAGIGQGDQHVMVGDHAEIAVAGLAGMDEEGRGAGAGHGRGDLARDVAGLAHAAYHNPSPAV
jgi:hypothetical protein